MLLHSLKHASNSRYMILFQEFMDIPSEIGERMFLLVHFVTNLQIILHANEQKERVYVHVALLQHAQIVFPHFNVLP